MCSPRTAMRKNSFNLVQISISKTLSAKVFSTLSFYTKDSVKKSIRPTFCSATDPRQFYHTSLGLMLPILLLNFFLLIPCSLSMLHHITPYDKLSQCKLIIRWSFHGINSPLSFALSQCSLTSHDVIRPPDKLVTCLLHITKV